MAGAQSAASHPPLGGDALLNVEDIQASSARMDAMISLLGEVGHAGTYDDFVHDFQSRSTPREKKKRKDKLCLILHESKARHKYGGLLADRMEEVKDIFLEMMRAYEYVTSTPERQAEILAERHEPTNPNRDDEEDVSFAPQRVNIFQALTQSGTSLGTVLAASARTLEEEHQSGTFKNITISGAEVVAKVSCVKTKLDSKFNQDRPAYDSEIKCETGYKCSECGEDGYLSRPHCEQHVFEKHDPLQLLISQRSSTYTIQSDLHDITGVKFTQRDRHRVREKIASSNCIPLVDYILSAIESDNRNTFQPYSLPTSAPQPCTYSTSAVSISTPIDNPTYTFPQAAQTQLLGKPESWLKSSAPDYKVGTRVQLLDPRVLHNKQTEGVMVTVENAPQWKKGQNCASCDVKLGLLSRVVSCYYCRATVCAECGAGRRSVLRYGYARKVCVCRKCIPQLNDWIYSVLLELCTSGLAYAIAAVKSFPFEISAQAKQSGIRAFIMASQSSTLTLVSQLELVLAAGTLTERDSEKIFPALMLRLTSLNEKEEALKVFASIVKTNPKSSLWRNLSQSSEIVDDGAIQKVIYTYSKISCMEILADGLEYYAYGEFDFAVELLKIAILKSSKNSLDHVTKWAFHIFDTTDKLCARKYAMHALGMIHTSEDTWFQLWEKFIEKTALTESLTLSTLAQVWMTMIPFNLADIHNAWLKPQSCNTLVMLKLSLQAKDKPMLWMREAIKVIQDNRGNVETAFRYFIQATANMSEISCSNKEHLAVQILFRLGHVLDKIKAGQLTLSARDVNELLLELAVKTFDRGNSQVHVLDLVYAIVLLATPSFGENKDIKTEDTASLWGQVAEKCKSENTCAALHMAYMIKPTTSRALLLGERILIDSNDKAGVALDLICKGQRDHGLESATDKGYFYLLVHECLQCMEPKNTRLLLQALSNAALHIGNLDEETTTLLKNMEEEVSLECTQASTKESERLRDIEHTLSTFMRTGNMKLVSNVLLDLWANRDIPGLQAVNSFLQRTIGHQGNILQLANTLLTELTSRKAGGHEQSLVDFTTALSEIALHDVLYEGIQDTINQIFTTPYLRFGLKSSVSKWIGDVQHWILSGCGELPEELLGDPLAARFAPLSGDETKYQHRIVRIPEFVVLAKCERGILRLRQAQEQSEDSLSDDAEDDPAYKLGISYADLVSACATMSSKCGCLVHSAYAFLEASKRSSPSRKYALEKQVETCLHLSLRISHDLDPILRLYYARLSSGILMRLMTNQTLSQDVFVGQTRVALLLNCIETVAELTPVFPVLCFPRLHACDQTFLGLITTKMSIGILQLQSPDSVPEHELVYHYLHGTWGHWIRGDNEDDSDHESDNEENVVRDEDEHEEKQRRERRRLRAQNSALDEARQVAMAAILRKRNWNALQVERNLYQCRLLSRSDDGFLDNQTLRDLGPLEYHDIHGFKLDLETGCITLKLERGDGRPGCFSAEDIAEVLGLGGVGTIFTLDPPGNESNIGTVAWKCHPFQEAKYLPRDLKGSRMLDTLLHCDYLLKFFTTGIEVSARAPFARRETAKGGGLLSRLPVNIRNMLQPVVSDVDSSSAKEGVAHRFWLDAEEIVLSEKISDNIVREYFGRVPMVVKTQLLVQQEDGTVVDAPISEQDDNSPEARFARTFSQHYDLISGHIYIFRRLRALYKLVAVKKRINQYAAGMQQNLNDTTQWEKIKSDMFTAKKASFDSIYSKLPQYPITFDSSAFEQVVSDAKQSVRNQHHGYIDEYELDQQVRNMLRPQEQQQRAEANSMYLNQHVTMFASQLGYSEACIRNDVNTYLSNGDSTALAEKAAQNDCNSLFAKQTQAVQKIRSSGFNIICQAEADELQGYGVNRDSSCSWVPAAFACNGRYRVYGGVNVDPKFTNGRVNPPPTSRYHLGGENLARQRGIGAVNSNAQRIDNQRAANHRFFAARIAAAQAAASSRATGSQASRTVSATQQISAAQQQRRQTGFNERNFQRSYAGQTRTFSLSSTHRANTAQRLTQMQTQAAARRSAAFTNSSRPPVASASSGGSGSGSGSGGSGNGSGSGGSRGGGSAGGGGGGSSRVCGTECYGGCRF
eukprot:m.25617 g.25617  ORF g.25617 m.25617 type:complete len:2092 (+) comp7722_c0_seq2:141-6416(+)